MAKIAATIMTQRITSDRIPDIIRIIQDDTSILQCSTIITATRQTRTVVILIILIVKHQHQISHHDFIFIDNYHCQQQQQRLM